MLRENRSSPIRKILAGEYLETRNSSDLSLEIFSNRTIREQMESFEPKKVELNKVNIL